MRAYQKALPVITKEELGQTPRFYVRCLVEMEDFINEVWEDRDGRKNMSKNNSKSLSTLRQKLRKYNKDFEEDIAKFRENPDQDDDEEDEKGLTTRNIYYRRLFKFKSFQRWIFKMNYSISAEEIIESEEEEDSAVAFKKAGSEASEPDVSKFKVLIRSRLTNTRG